MDRRLFKPRSLLPSIDEIASAPITQELVLIADAHADVTVLVDDFYRNYVETRIRPHPIPERNTKEFRDQRLTHYKTLKCPSLRMPLCLIWKNSTAYIDDISCGRFKESDFLPPRISINDIGLSIWQAEFNRQRHHTPPTEPTPGVARVTRVLSPEQECPSQKQYVMQATRLVEAAMTYGLVEKKRISKRKLHIDGTRRLHEMMVRIEAMHLILAHDAIHALQHGDDNNLLDQG